MKNSNLILPVLVAICCCVLSSTAVATSTDNSQQNIRVRRVSTVSLPPAIASESKKRKATSAQDSGRSKSAKVETDSSMGAEFDSAEQLVSERKYSDAYQKYIGILKRCNHKYAESQHRASTAIARMRQWDKIDEISCQDAYSYFEATMRGGTARRRDKASAMLGCADLIISGRVEGDKLKASGILSQVIGDVDTSSRDMVFAKLLKACLWSDMTLCRVDNNPREIYNMLGEVITSHKASPAEVLVAKFYKAKVGYQHDLVNPEDTKKTLWAIANEEDCPTQSKTVIEFLLAEVLLKEGADSEESSSFTKSKAIAMLNAGSGQVTAAAAQPPVEGDLDDIAINVLNGFSPQ